jgi:hypothetical protein
MHIDSRNHHKMPVFELAIPHLEDSMEALLSIFYTSLLVYFSFLCAQLWARCGPPWPGPPGLPCHLASVVEFGQRLQGRMGEAQVCPPCSIYLGCCVTGGTQWLQDGPAYIAWVPVPGSSASLMSPYTKVLPAREP